MFSVNCIDSHTKIRLLKCFSPYFSLHNYIIKMGFHKSCSAHLWNISQPSTGFFETFHSSKEDNCTIEQLALVQLNGDIFLFYNKSLGDLNVEKFTPQHSRKVDGVDDVWHAYPLRPGISTT
jgi:hypothetical protein